MTNEALAESAPINPALAIVCWICQIMVSIPFSNASSAMKYLSLGADSFAKDLMFRTATTHMPLNIETRFQGLSLVCPTALRPISCRCDMGKLAPLAAIAQQTHAAHTHTQIRA
jgi:hypothetical protein